MPKPPNVPDSDETLSRKDKFFQSKRKKSENAKAEDKPEKKREKPDFIKRVRRLLYIIQASKNKRPKIRELAEMCHTTERTIYRDIADLTKIGIIIATDLKTGRVSSPDMKFLPPVQFTAEEAFAMLTILYESAKKPTFPPLFNSLDEATLKLMGVFPQEVIEQIRPFSDAVTIQRPAFHLHEESESLFHLVREAITKRRCLQVRYKSPLDPGEIVTRLDPYHIFFARHAWYVVGRASLFQEVRTFHLGRFRQIEMLDEKFNIPLNFSMENYLGNAWSLIREPGPDQDVEIQFSKLVGQNVAEVLWHKTQRTETQQTGNTDDGTVRFHATVSGLNEISWWILGYGKEAEAIQPPALRELIRKHVIELYKKYVTEETSVLNQPQTPPDAPLTQHPLGRLVEPE